MADEDPIQQIGDDEVHPQAARGRRGRGRGRGRGGRGRGGGGGRRGAVPRAVAQAQNLDGDEDEALPHQQAIWWFGTITNLEGRNAEGQPNPENPQLYIDWDVPEGARGNPVICAQWQGERGLPSERRMNGLLHVQITLGLQHHMRYRQLNTALGLEDWQARWFVCRSPPHAWDYCSKDESRLPGAAPKFFGERPPDRYAKRKQTEEDKVDIIVKCVEDRVPFQQMWKGEHRALMLRHWRTFLEVRNYLDQPGFEFIPKLIYYLYGPTGSDKSKNMWDFVRALDLPYWVSGGLVHGKYFTGYDQQPIIMFDEVRRFESVSILLQLLDGRESVQEMKLSGARVIIRAKIIIFTSDRDLDQIEVRGTHPITGKEGWVKMTPDELMQVKRRIRELPRMRPGVPNPWPNHPIGNIIHHQDTRAFPNFVNRPLPLLTNAQRQSMRLPLISVERERELFPHLYGLDGAPLLPLALPPPQDMQLDQELRELFNYIQQANGRAVNEMGLEQLLDDDLGLPEPPGALA